jgi:hypothetical protein
MGQAQQRAPSDHIVIVIEAKQQQRVVLLQHQRPFVVASSPAATVEEPHRIAHRALPTSRYAAE